MFATAIAALLAACAGTAPQKTTPAPAPAPSATSRAVAPATTPSSDKFATIDATNLVEAQKAGYKVVNENGQQLFCRRDTVTGTRLQHRTTCLTAQQLMEMNAKAAEAMRGAPLPNYDQLHGGAGH
ncbi:MAG TPA: hypothetical protein VG994_05455 [Steroidobacteraceae bacterium]|nr:hypothetical protein [Steroidobacteraceae bacterium]